LSDRKSPARSGLPYAAAILGLFLLVAGHLAGQSGLTPLTLLTRLTNLSACAVFGSGDIFLRGVDCFTSLCLEQKESRKEKEGIRWCSQTGEAAGITNSNQSPLVRARVDLGAR